MKANKKQSGNPSIELSSQDDETLEEMSEYLRSTFSAGYGLETKMQIATQFTNIVAEKRKRAIARGPQPRTPK